MGAGTVVQFALGVLAPAIVEDLALSRFQLGVMTSTLFLVASVASPVMGWWVDQRGGLGVIRLVFAISATSILALAAAHHFVVLLVAVAVAGTAMAAANPATNAVTADFFEPVRQPGVIGIKQSGVQVGAFSAGFLPLLAQGVGWRGALMVTGMVCVAGLLLTAQRGSTAATLATQTVVPTRSRSKASVFADRDVRYLAAYAATMGPGVAVTGTYLPLYAVEHLEVTPAHAGILAGVLGITGIVMRLVWSWLLQRGLAASVALRRIGALAVLAQSLLLASVPLKSVAFAWLGVIGLGTTVFAWNAVGMLAILRRFPTGQTGPPSGIVMMAFYAGFVVGAPVIGLLVDRTGGYTSAWLAAAAAYAMGWWIARIWSQSGVREHAGTPAN